MKKNIVLFLSALAFCACTPSFAASAQSQGSNSDNPELDLVLHDFVTYAQGYCEGLREADKVPFSSCLDQTVSLELALLENALQPPAPYPLPGFSQKV